MAKGSTNTIVVVGGKSGASSFTVPSCANVTARSASGKIYIKWTDPDNIYDGGKLISWTKSEVRLIVSSSSDDDAYPKKVTDGTLVGTFTTKNQYKTTELEFTPPSTIGADANCRIMVYAHCSIAGDTKDYVNGEYEAQASAQFQIKSYSTWTVIIDESNSNPLSCCTYADDAVGMTKGSDEWDEIFGYKPCVFKDGAVYKYLNPNDFTKFADGTDATNYMSMTTSYASVQGYDVMIEFPRMGLKITNANNKITISLTDNPNSEDFRYYAHESNGVAKNTFYLGAYDGWITNAYQSKNTLRSLSGSTYTTGGLTIFEAATSRSNYCILAFYQMLYIQALYIVKYGNLNSQVAVGNGAVGVTTALKAGTMDANGMCYGNTTNQTTGMKLFGLEHLWGNVPQWVCGVRLDSSTSVSNRIALFTTTNVQASTTTATYQEQGVLSTKLSGTQAGYIKTVFGTTGAGFVSNYKTGSGSATTYYCDYTSLTALYPAGTVRFGYFGGGSDSGDSAGIFQCYINYNSSNSGLTSRLMYL